MPGEVRLEVVVDTKTGQVAVRELTQEMQSLEAKGTKPAAAGLRSMTLEQRQAAQAAQLLAMRMGVNLPRAVEQVIAKSRLLGPALTAAFNVSIVLAMGAAFIALLPKIAAVVDHIRGITPALFEMEKAVIDFNKRAIEALGGLTGKQMRSHLAALSAMRQAWQKIMEDPGKRTFWEALRMQAPRAYREAKEAIAGLDVQIQLLAETLILYQNKQKAAAQDTSKWRWDLGQIVVSTADWRREFEKLRELRIERFMASIENEAVGVAQSFEEAVAQAKQLTGVFEAIKPAPAIAVRALPELTNLQAEILRLQEKTTDLIQLEYRRDLDNFQELLNKKKISEAEFQQAKVLLQQRADVQIAQENKERFEQMAKSIEGFFDRVFLTARSFGDMWKQLWMQLVRFFVQQVARMVAAWILGQRQMATGGGIFGGGGIGGILGGLFGGLFGIPGIGQAPGVAGGSWGGLGARPYTSPLGIAAGIGGAGGVTATVMRQSLWQRLGGWGGLLGGAGGLLATAGLLPLIAGIRAGKPLYGALGGGMLGAALGAFEFGAAGIGFGGGLMGGLIGFGIGAAIGGIIAAIVSWIKRGKQKRRASRIAEEGFAGMQEVLKQFRAFQVDYESAISGVTQIWETMVAAWKRIGGVVGRRSIRGQEPWFRQVLAEIERIQKAREARAQVIAALPVPEFQFGGIVKAINAWNGRVLAVLHQGEAVLTRRATQALGEENISRLNRGQGPAGGDTFIIYAVDAPSLVRILERNRGAVVRKLRTWARDQGKRAPV